jgi:hypothetical protein
VYLRINMRRDTEMTNEWISMTQHISTLFIRFVMMPLALIPVGKGL